MRGRTFDVLVLLAYGMVGGTLAFQLDFAAVQWTLGLFTGIGGMTLGELLAARRHRIERRARMEHIGEIDADERFFTEVEMNIIRQRQKEAEAAGNPILREFNRIERDGSSDAWR